MVWLLFYAWVSQLEIAVALSPVFFYNSLPVALGFQSCANRDSILMSESEYMVKKCDPNLQELYLPEYARDS